MLKKLLLYCGLLALVLTLAACGGAPLPTRMFPTTNRTEQKSLVTRLINRIRSL